MAGVKKFGDYEVAQIKKAMASVARFDSLALPAASGGLWTVPLFERYPHLVDVLASGVQAEIGLLMIDLSSFSKATRGLSPSEIGELLDPFYEKLVSEIQRAGGVIEKFIGDAVISLFGHPFRKEGANDPTSKAELMAALNVAKACIAWSHETYRGVMTAKAALTFGEVFVGWVGPRAYSDLTVIGSPMTELFRLESVAPKEGVIMPYWLYEKNIRPRIRFVSDGQPAAWHHGQDVFELRGVGRLEVATINYRPE